MTHPPLPVTGHTRSAIVIGDPVRHSLSPRIHNAAFAALGLDWCFLAMPVRRGEAQAALAAIRTLGIDGCSVTMPHKEAVADGVDELEPSARALGSVNCVRRDGSKLIGDSTDGIGFVRALESELGRSIEGANVTVLGAGGAARSIIDALDRAGVERIVVANRSRPGAERAADLSSVAVVGDASDASTADLVVNTTPVGMAGGPDPDGCPIDTDLLRPKQIVADIVYQPRRTALLGAAEARGATTIGGLGMLIQQAAVAFEWWTGRPAPIAAMTAAVEPYSQGISGKPSD
jgi:shikimate dehydrogenase